MRLGGAQVGSHLPSACLPLLFRLNHTAPQGGGHAAPPPRAVPASPQHLAPCLRLPIGEGGLRLLLSTSTHLAQGLGSTRTQGGTGTSCLSFWIPAGGEVCGWTPAGVLTDSGLQFQGGGCQGSWAHSQGPHPATPWALRCPPPLSLSPPDHPGTHPTCPSNSRSGC